MSSALDTLRIQAAACQACDLYKHATQTVFGEGRAHAPLMLVGEQPGNDEDLAGHPFVGPAGKLLNQALLAAGIDRSQAYLTNAVKHFKFEPRGKRRIHQKPAGAEVQACLPWLRAELDAVRPNVLVCLGATAAQALLGSQFRVTKDRGRLLDSNLAKHVMATVHPSSILRADAVEREQQMQLFIQDLQVAAALLKV